MPRAVHDSLSSISISGKFAATYRLLRKDGFSHVLGAENVAGKHFKLFFVRNSKKNARLGIIVSKKSFPRAVDRNRVKRAIREAFRQHSVKLRKLDLIVMVARAYAQQRGTQSGNLEMLFSQAEDRCAEL